MCQLSASSRKLAQELATRLSQIIPPPFTAHADGDSVSILAEGVLIGSSEATAIVDDDDGRPLGQKYETAVRSVLGAVQDCITEHLEVPWPRPVGQSMPMPGARWNGLRVHMWYGDDEDIATVNFPPIDVVAKDSH